MKLQGPSACQPRAYRLLRCFLQQLLVVADNGSCSFCEDARPAASLCFFLHHRKWLSRPWLGAAEHDRCLDDSAHGCCCTALVCSPTCREECAAEQHAGSSPEPWQHVSSGVLQPEPDISLRPLCLASVCCALGRPGHRTHHQCHLLCGPSETGESCRPRRGGTTSPQAGCVGCAAGRNKARVELRLNFKNAKTEEAARGSPSSASPRLACHAVVPTLPSAPRRARQSAQALLTGWCSLVMQFSHLEVSATCSRSLTVLPPAGLCSCSHSEPETASHQPTHGADTRHQHPTQWPRCAHLGGLGHLVRSFLSGCGHSATVVAQSITQSVVLRLNTSAVGLGKSTLGDLAVV